MIYDVLIIGGGPAGMMAAGRAGERGARVLLLERNNSLGVKLLATGNGRCNITNESADSKETIDVYGPNCKFLYSAFSKFGVESTMDFFSDLKISLKTEDHGRVFPKSDRAIDVQRALMASMKKNGVEVMCNARVKKIVDVDERIEKVVLENGKEVVAKNFLIATGGKSYPATGSSGDAYGWLKNLGLCVNTVRPSLTPVTVKEKYVKQLEGLSLNNVVVSIFQNGKKVHDSLCEIIFTADGLSGPGILNLSSRIGALLSAPVNLQLDFQNELSKRELEEEMQKDFHNSNNKILKNYLTSRLAPKLIPIILKLTGIDGQKQVNVITRDERSALLLSIKEFTLEVSALKGFDKAMISAGGVDTRELDPKTMRSRKYLNLYLAGEVLDLDGPTGGYNLQICWSTGYVAGDSVIFQ